MKRSELEITLAFLEVSQDESNKTAFVYKTNTNFILAGRYLSLLLDNNLIEKIGCKYRITETGKQYLKTAKSLVLNKK